MLQSNKLPQSISKPSIAPSTHIPNLEFNRNTRRNTTARSSKSEYKYKPYPSSQLNSKTTNIYGDSAFQKVFVRSNNNPKSKQTEYLNTNKDYFNYEINTLLQKNREQSKIQIQEHSSQLREKICFKIEEIFRSIWEEGDQFYEVLYTILNLNKQLPVQLPAQLYPSSNSQDKIQTIKRIQKYIIKSLKTNSSFYNKQKMDEIVQKMGQKIKAYLEEVREKNIGNLFKIHHKTEPSQNKFKYYTERQKSVDTHHRNQYSRRDKHEYREHKSQSVYKYSNHYPHSSLNNNSSLLSAQCSTNLKQKQFQQLYDKIISNKMIRNSRNNSISNEHIEYKVVNKFKTAIEDPYGIHYNNSKDAINIYNSEEEFYNNHIQTGNFMIHSPQAPSPFQSVEDSKNLTNYSEQNRPISNAHLSLPQSAKPIPMYNSYSISKIHNKSSIRQKLKYQHNLTHNIILNPILNLTYNQYDLQTSANPSNFSTNNPNFNKKEALRNTRYLLDANQQCITCDWCEEIVMNGVNCIFIDELKDKMQTKKQRQMNVKDLPEVSVDSKNQKQTNIQDQSNILCLTYCNNYTHLAIGSKNSLIYIYQTHQYRQVTKLGGHSSSVTCLYFNNQNNLLFSGGDAPCNSIFIWHTQTWTIRSKLSFHSAAISSLVTISNTDYLISTSFDRTMKLYNYNSSQITHTHTSSSSIFTKLLYYPQLQCITALKPQKSISMWEVNMGNDENKGYKLNSETIITCGGKVTNIEKGFNKQKNLLIAGLHNGYIEIYRIPEGDRINRVEVTRNSILSFITFSRNNKSEYPLVLALNFASKVLNVVNTQNGFVSQLNVKGNLDINFTQGIGPVLIANERYQLAWVDQSEDSPRFIIGKFTIY